MAGPEAQAQRDTRGARRAAARPAIAFVGSALSFSEQMLRIVDAEFGDIDVIRVDEIGTLTDNGSSSDRGLRLVVLEEALAPDLADRMDVYRSFAGSAALVLAYRDIDAIRRLIPGGRRAEVLSALSFLPMDTQFDIWLSILRLLVVGESYCPRDVLGLMTEAAAQPAVAPAALKRVNGGGEDLTQREREVLALVSEGMQNKNIASELGLSEHTVKLHIHHIISKLGVKNRTGATIWYLSQLGGPGRARSTA